MGKEIGFLQSDIIVKSLRTYVLINKINVCNKFRQELQKGVSRFIKVLNRPMK